MVTFLSVATCDFKNRKRGNLAQVQSYTELPRYPLHGVRFQTYRWYTCMEKADMTPSSTSNVSCYSGESTSLNSSKFVCMLENLVKFIAKLLAQIL